MPTLPLTKKDVPFLLGGSGEFAVETGDLAFNQPISDATSSVLSVGFKGGGNQKISLGQDNSVKIGVSAAANVNLTPVFATSTGVRATILKSYGIGDFFKGANNDKVVLAFEAGASAEAAATAPFTYSALKASVELDAGVDAGFAYLRALDKTLPIQKILPAFFQTMRLPEQGGRAPEPGEAISLKYGGYLRMAAEVSAGYKLAGTKSVSIGQLILSEKYDLSILGKIGLSAGVAGRFSILVTGAGDLPGWARVQVRRQRSKDLKIAADVNVTFKNQLDDLPSSANEFLGAALGVNAKSFLNVFKKAVELSDFKAFEGAIDGLARKYVEEFIGKSFDTLQTKTEFAKFLKRVNQVVTSYDTVEDRAVTLFDRYFDKLDELTGFLDKIQSLGDGAISTLRKELSPELWKILAQLTDGDPLGFLLEQVTIRGKKVNSLAELQKRAAGVLDLIQNAAHEEIRRVVGLAKHSFGIDKLFGELAKIDTVDELKALANEKAGFFVTRLVGRTLDSATNLKQALDEVHKVLGAIDGFAEKLFKAFKEVANSSYKVALHTEYSRASETDSLIDVVINMTEARGADLLAQAGKGDFEEIIGTSNTDLVRLKEGVLTHRTRREGAFNVNIIGWHLNYRYEGFDRVLTETEQRLIPSDQGLTVLTTASVEVERLRKRRDEQVHVNFLLRALGESAKAVKSDKANLGYLIDSLNSLTARYQLVFTDADTSAVELQDYLAFARDLGLDARGATFAELGPLLPKTTTGSFGNVTASYDVRFGQKALETLLSVKDLSKSAEAAVRNAMRQIVLSNYLKSDSMHDVAFSYATPGVFKAFSDEGFAAFALRSPRVFQVQVPNSAIAAPSSVTLDRMELNVLTTLYDIESRLVEAIKNLYKLLKGAALDPAEFEKRLGKFGEAMNAFDGFDQTTNQHGIGTNTIFAMFDVLVRLASGGSTANTAVLTLKSQAGGKEVEKLFL